ncbi:PaaI family thioesterase [Mycobacterium sp. BMJ-28]
MLCDDDPKPTEALYASLANSVRRLVDVTIRSQTGPATIASAQRKIDDAVDELSNTLIPGSFGLPRTPEGRILTWGNAVTGMRNALAAPLVVYHKADGSVWADVTLGAAYEGPAEHVHGGVCALLLDHVLGAAAHRPGQPAVTGSLALRYEMGTPLGPVHAEAHIDRVEGAKTIVVGHLGPPQGISVRAEGIFFHPPVSGP